MTAAPHVPYWCPTSQDVERCPEHSGWDVCCDRPELHARVWRMFAAWRRGPGGVAVLANFGDERYVRFYGQEPIPVELVEDPGGDLWGWIDAKSESGEPVMIQSHEKLFRVQFPYGAEAEVERGKGEIVRLSCRALDGGEVP